LQRNILQKKTITINFYPDLHGRLRGIGEGLQVKQQPSRFKKKKEFQFTEKNAIIRISSLQ